MYSNETARDHVPVQLDKSVRATQCLREMQGVHVLDALLGQSSRAHLHDQMPQRDPPQQGDEEGDARDPTPRALVLSAQAYFVDHKSDEFAAATRVVAEQLAE